MFSPGDKIVRNLEDQEAFWHNVCKAHGFDSTTPFTVDYMLKKNEGVVLVESIGNRLIGWYAPYFHKITPPKNLEEWL